MYCIYCGSKNDDQNRFCEHCGRPLAAAPGTPVEEPVAPGAREDAPSPETEAPAFAAPSGTQAAPAAADGLDAPTRAAAPPAPDDPRTGSPTAGELIVRGGTWLPTTGGLAAPPPPEPAPIKPARFWAVLAPCLGVLALSAAALVFLLLRDGPVAADSPAFSVFVPAGLGIAAVACTAAALILALTGREETPESNPAAGTADATRPAGVPRVVLTDDARPEQAFTLALEQPVEIGRAAMADGGLAIPYEKSISKRHCRLYAAQGAVFLEDLGGRNGTYLNGNAVLVPTSLHTGDRIKLGRLELRVLIDP